jgi:hypothetical protein
MHATTEAERTTVSGATVMATKCISGTLAWIFEMLDFDCKTTESEDSSSSQGFLIQSLGHAGMATNRGQCGFNGECGCLLATLATARGLRYDKIPGLEPNSARPSERFYLLISKGDTPETSWAAAMADQWAAEFEVENSAK